MSLFLVLTCFATVPHKLWNRQLHEFGFTICPLQQTRASWSSALLLMPLFDSVIRAYIPQFLSCISHDWDRPLWLRHILESRSHQTKVRQSALFQSVKWMALVRLQRRMSQLTPYIWLRYPKVICILFSSLLVKLFSMCAMFFTTTAMLFFPSLTNNTIWFLKMLD